MAMTAEDELIHLRHTNTLLQEQVEAQGETIRVQQAQIAALTKQVQELQGLILVFGEPLRKFLHLIFLCTPRPRPLGVM